MKRRIPRAIFPCFLAGFGFVLCLTGTWAASGAATPAKRSAEKKAACPAPARGGLAAEHADTALAKTLAPGDEVRITMEEDPEVTYTGKISASGTIPIPYLGEFPVAGLTCRQVEERLGKALCQDLYQKATIHCILTATAPGKVYVYGAVKEPGIVSFPETGRLTMLQLLSMVGGLTSWAAPEDTYVLRRKRNTTDKTPQKIQVNLKKLLSTMNPSADFDLHPDDAVFVPGMNGNTEQVMSSDACEIIVVGQVNQPGIVTFAPGEERTLMRAIFKAGGFTKFAKKSAVRLIRYEKNGKRDEKKVNASAIIDEGYLDKDVTLLPGDMLIIPQKLINF